MYMHMCMWVLLGAILICVCWVAGAFVFVCSLGSISGFVIGGNTF